MKHLKMRGHCLLSALAMLAGVNYAAAQGTAFTYQGQLDNGGSPAGGLYDFRFSLFDASSGGSQVGPNVTNLAVGVTNGLFSAPIDFGPGIFTGSKYWLEVAVRTNKSASPVSFTSLSPLQPITPEPYAIFAAGASNAATAGSANSVAAANVNGTLGLGQLPSVLLTNNGTGVSLTGAFSGNGSGLTNLNATRLASGTVADARLSANVPLLNADQSFSGVNTFAGPGPGFIVNGGPVSTSLFTGFGLQFDPGTGEGAIMSSINDGRASLTFYTKQGAGYPVAEQMKIDRYGVVSIDGQANNNGVLNDGTTNGVALVFGGGGSGEGIASQRTPGVNKDGLDFYTGNQHQMSILHNGNVGVGVTNPSTALQVSGTVSANAFSGDGSALTNLNAAVFSSGIISLAQLPPALGQISTPGYQNFYAGAGAGAANQSATDNTGVGADSLFDTSGSFNSANGAFALMWDTTGSYNTADGAYALSAATTLYVTGSENTADGAYALAALNAGSNNVAVGYGALQASVIGNLNTAIGYNGLQALTSGNGNIAVGDYAGFALTSGNNNIYIGNNGNSSESGIIRIGSPASQTATYIAGNVGLGGATPEQTLSLNGGMNIDESSLNNGTVNNALTFGTSSGSTSGEGIGSIRASGSPDSFGLNFYTDYGKRMTIANGGNVGIGTSSPSQALEINGEFMMVDGLGGVKCYIGDDGSGNDVQVGSLKSGITAVAMYNAADSAYMHVYCSSITIEGGSDLAEPFPITTAAAEVSLGAVMVIDEQNPGRLKLSDQPYDTRVAGVISGANGIHPGIQMQQQGLLEGGQNVALTGRVYVRADTSNGAIKPGDLLTTSATPGHAMKVSDHARAQGAILGKAMTALPDGKGMVLVLVTLQ